MGSGAAGSVHSVVYVFGACFFAITTFFLVVSD